MTFECPACDGADEECEACDGSGEGRLETCPLDYVTPDVWEAIRMAELFEKGLPPVAGGTLDQAAVFLDAARFVWGEQAHWRAELGIMRWPT